MLRKKVTVLLLVFYVLSGSAQVSFRIDNGIAFPNLRVKISPDVSFPDISVSIGKDIAFEDFTVGVTSNRSMADFIISDSPLSDITVNASETVPFADIVVRYGQQVPFTNVKVKIKEYGEADYLVYTERSAITLEEIVVAILPALNSAMDYKFDKLPSYAGKFKNQKHDVSRSSGSGTDVVCELSDAKIFAQDKEGTYLGKICNEYDSESIFNEFGRYGSEFGTNSIWNKLSEYGNQHSAFSPFNPTALNPPKIVKEGKVIGFLSIRNLGAPAFSPLYLKRLRSEF